MSLYYVCVAAFILAAAWASYLHTRRFGTKRNVNIVYKLMFGILLVESACNSMFPSWNVDYWLFGPLVLLWCAVPVGSMLTWLRIKGRGNNWAQVIALRELNALRGI